MVLDEKYLQLLAQELGHGVLDELVGDGLFGLVFIAGLGGEVTAHQQQALLHVGEGDLAFALGVFVVLPQIFVQRRHKGQAGGLVGAAAVLQEAGVVIVLHQVHPVGKAPGDVQLHLVFGLVRPVPALALRLPAHGPGDGVVPGQLGQIVPDAVFIQEVLGLEPPGGHLAAQPEGHPSVDHRLPLHHVLVIVQGDVDVGEHLQVRQPADGGAGFLPGQGGDLHLPHDLAPLEVELILIAVPADGNVHIAAGVLGGAGAQTVQAQGELIVFPGGVVLASGVHLAEHQLPVVPPLLFVPVHGTAPALVLHLDGPVLEPGDGDHPSEARPGLVNGVGENLEHRVLAALQPVGAENDAGPFPDPVRSLQAGNAVVVVCFFLGHILPPAAEAANSPIYKSYFNAKISVWQEPDGDGEKMFFRGKKLQAAGPP